MELELLNDDVAGRDAADRDRRARLEVGARDRQVRSARRRPGRREDEERQALGELRRVPERVGGGGGDGIVCGDVDRQRHVDGREAGAVRRDRRRPEIACSLEEFLRPVGARVVGEKVEIELGRSRAADEPLDAGRSAFGAVRQRRLDRRDDREVLQQVGAGVAVARVVRRDAVPPRSIPRPSFEKIEFPRIVFPTPSSMLIPLVLNAITLPSPGAVPPIVASLAWKPIWMPSVPLGRGEAQSICVPMQLPWMTSCSWPMLLPPVPRTIPKPDVAGDQVAREDARRSRCAGRAADLRAVAAVECPDAGEVVRESRRGPRRPSR